MSWWANHGHEYKNGQLVLSGCSATSSMSWQWRSDGHALLQQHSTAAQAVTHSRYMMSFMIGADFSGVFLQMMCCKLNEYYYDDLFPSPIGLGFAWMLGRKLSVSDLCIPTLMWFWFDMLDHLTRPACFCYDVMNRTFMSLTSSWPRTRAVLRIFQRLHKLRCVLLCWWDIMSYFRLH